MVEEAPSYDGGLRNFFTLYLPLAPHWRLYDSSTPVPRLVAEGLETGLQTVYDQGEWDVVTKQATARRNP